MRLNDHRVELDTKEFKETMNTLIKENSIDWVIETGTAQGIGSTLVFAKTGAIVITMECWVDNVTKARNNLKAYPNVKVFHATSLPFEIMVQAISDMSTMDFPEHIRCDVLDPENFYLHEVGHDVEQEAFLEECLENGPLKKLVFLDSAGGIGLAETKLVIQKCLGDPVLLVLDDVDHVKHYYSIPLLKKENLHVHVSSDGRFAWCWMNGDT
jgi:hypothetical protein